MDPSFFAIVESYRTLKGKFDLVFSVCHVNNDSMVDTLQNEMESLKVRKGMSIQDCINRMPYLVLIQVVLRNRILQIQLITFTITTPSTTVQNSQKAISPASDKTLPAAPHKLHLSQENIEPIQNMKSVLTALQAPTTSDFGIAPDFRDCLEHAEHITLQPIHQTLSPRPFQGVKDAANCQCVLCCIWVAPLRTVSRPPFAPPSSSRVC